MPRHENPERAMKAKEGLYCCSNCHEFLTREHFRKQTQSKYGVYGYCIPCSGILRSKDLEKTRRQLKANDGLYYCDECKTYLSRRFFTPVEKGRFGLRNKCKPCSNELSGKLNQRMKITIPQHLSRDIKTLRIFRSKSLQDTLLELITKELSIRQKPQTEP